VTRRSAVVYLSLALVTALVVYYQIVDEYFLYAFCEEDCLVEWATVVFYLFAAYLFIFKDQGRKNPWKLLLALLFISLAGEEISWGQRLFQYEVPNVVGRINVQNEFNLHNLQAFQGIIRGAGVLVFCIPCFVIPLTNRFSGRCRRWYARMRIPIFPLEASVVAAAAVLLMIVPRLFLSRTTFNFDEIGEAYFAAAMFLFALDQRGRS